jgi:hypothetical protein
LNYNGYCSAEVDQLIDRQSLCTGVEAGSTVVSDGGQWFRCIAEQPGIVHERLGFTAAPHRLNLSKASVSTQWNGTSKGGTASCPS